MMNRGLFGLMVLRLGNARYCDHIGYMPPHLLEKKWKNQWLCARRGACTGEQMGRGGIRLALSRPLFWLLPWILRASTLMRAHHGDLCLCSQPSRD